MSAISIAGPTLPRSVPAGWVSLWLTESVRVARHPAFLTGLAGAAISYYLNLNSNLEDPDRLNPGIGALFIGVVGLALMSARARAMRRSDEVVGSTPMSTTARTAALCAACVVPFAAGLALFGFEMWSLRLWPLDEWAHAGFSDADHVAISWSTTAMAALGGPLLGVAVGRWLRFPGATVVAVVAVMLWVFGATQPTLVSEHVSTWQTGLRLTAPYAFFQTASGTPRAVDAFPGSPWWYIGWQVCLCAMAVVAALLKGAEVTTRRRLVLVGWAFLALGLAAWVLAFAGGFPDWLRTFPDGTTQWGGSGV